MARKTTKRRSASRSRSSSRKKERLIPGWLWLLMGIAVGVVVAYSGQLRELLQNRDIEVQTTVNTPVTIETPVSKAKAAEPREEPKVVTIIPPKQEPKYDFYYRLPKEEVIVREEQVREATKPAMVFQTPAKPDANGKSYLIQAGSFRSPKDADRRKAQLALLGLQASIEKVKTDSGEWHRVRLGPYGSLDQVNQIRTDLHSNQIKTLLVNASGQ